MLHLDFSKQYSFLVLHLFSERPWVFFSCELGAQVNDKIFLLVIYVLRSEEVLEKVGWENSDDTSLAC